MRWKTTAVLAVILIALGAFFYVYEVRQGPAREKSTAEKDRLWKGLETKDVDELTIARGSESIHLKKSGDAWALASPVQGRAESRPIEDLLTSLTTLRVEREIEPNPAKPADFGLEPPAAEIVFTAKGEKRRIRLGGKNPTGLWVYAQAGDKPAVVLVPDSLLRDAQKPVADFRDRTVLAFEPKDVKKLEVQTPGGQTVAVVHKGKPEPLGPEQWDIAEPVALHADREQVSNLLEKLKTAKIKDFVPEAPKGPAEYGLDRPLRLTLWLGEEKERVAKTLRLGKTVPDKKTVYAQREGDGTIFTLEEEFFRAIPTSVTAFRDKTVLAFERQKVEKVELESPKGKLTLALEDGLWRIAAPVQLKADQTTAVEVMSRVQELRAKEFVDEGGKPLARFGLDRPQIRVVVWEKEAKEPKALLLAPAREKDLAYATVSGGGPSAPIVLVEGKVLQDLARSVQDLRDHSFFAAFDARDVTRVQIQRGAETLVLERTGEEEWQLVAPRKGKAAGGRVSDLIWMLRNLKWRDLVAEQGWDPTPYGLQPPATTLTLTGKDGKTVAALAIGKREKGNAYVRVPDQPALYAIDANNLGELPSTPEDLLL